MSALYDNQGREQPLQPPEVVCRDEAVEPAPILCTRCHKADPAEGADQCGPCLIAIEREEILARFDAAIKEAA